MKSLHQAAILSFLGLLLFCTQLTQQAVAQETDISGNIQITKGRVYFDRLNRVSYFPVQLLNNATTSYAAPIHVYIENITQGVTVSNPDGFTPDGIPYFDYSETLDDQLLSAQELSSEKVWRFNNPFVAIFSYTTRVVQVNSPQSYPEIQITNPINGGIIANTKPFVTITYSDSDSEIDTSTLSVQIDGEEKNELFSITPSAAFHNYDEGLAPGNHQIVVTVSNSDGNLSTEQSTFTVTNSGPDVKYLFSLDKNPWIFTSAGDGTYNEYLPSGELGVTEGDINAISLDQSDTLYFLQPGESTVFKTYGDSIRREHLGFSELGATGEKLRSIFVDLDGKIHFTKKDDDNIYVSIGDSTNNLFATGSSIDMSGSPIQALHIDYDGYVYFASTNIDGIFKSATDYSKQQFLSRSDLGIPGGSLDGFAIIPDIGSPEITIISPLDGAFLNITTPQIKAIFSDSEAGIDISSFKLIIGNTDYTNTCSIGNSEATCTLNSGLTAGNHTIQAAIADRAGNTATDSIGIKIGILRAIPGATPVTGTAPLTVHFSTDAEDPAGTIEYFRWDFDGNGSWNTYDTVAKDYNYTFSIPGTYEAKLWVQSSTGDSASATVEITVQNNPPTAAADVTPSNGQIPLLVQMTGTGSDSDGNIVLYEWDFEGDGTYDWSSDTTGNTSYIYTAPGDYQAVFRVTDNSGLTATAKAAQTIVRAGPPGSPTATAGASPSQGNAPLNVSLAGSATDPENDVVLYEWDFEGDGTYDWSSDTTGNTTHNYTTAGTHEARLRVTDATGLTGIDQVLITVNIQTSLSVSKETVGFYDLDDSGLKPASAETNNIHSNSYAASKAIDSNTGTYWHTQYASSTAGIWFEVTLNKPETVSSLNLYWYSTSYMMNTTKVEIFDIDNATVYNQEHSLSGSTSIIQLPDVENVYRIRLTQLSSRSGYLVLREFSYISKTSEIEPRGSNIVTNISAGTPVTVLIKNSSGDTVRTLINNEYRAKGSYSDYWDCRDDNNIVVNDGLYYAVMQYIVDGAVKSLDLTETTGGSRYTPSRSSVPSNNNTAAPFEDKMLPIYFKLNKASEVTLFVGVLWTTNTRVRTIYNRLPLPAGDHIAWWDGLDDNENIAVTPSGNQLILGIWGYTLPDNAMYMTGGKPVVSSITAEPNYYSPFSEKCDSEGNGEGILLGYNLSEDVSTVELRVYSLDTGNLIHTASQSNIKAGQNTFYWDGKNNEGEYPDIDDYQIGLIATDPEGNKSMLNYTLIRVAY